MTARDEMVERLEMERLGGMPRWQVRAQEVTPDPLPVTAARRKALAALQDDTTRKVA